MENNQKKLIFIYKNKLGEESKLEQSFFYTDTPNAESIAAMVRLFMVMMGYSPEMAERLIFVDDEEFEDGDYERGNFCPSLPYPL